jgi:hypothetical protein
MKIKPATPLLKQKVNKNEEEPLPDARSTDEDIRQLRANKKY